LLSNNLSAILLGALAFVAAAEDAPIHGMWVWKSASVLAAPGAAEALRDFCRSQGVNEVYLAVPADGAAALAYPIALLHRAHIRVEALLSSTNANERGKHRQKLLNHVRAIVEFNRGHTERFDGIHLDIEPQQGPESKRAGNLAFLPGLVQTYREVRALAEPAQLAVNADIPNKVLKGSLAERRMLLTSLPRFTLMLYELSSADEAKLFAASHKFLDMAYEGLEGDNAGRMAVGLRTPDYGERLAAMLRMVEEANGANSHYLGWARHSYNDVLPAR
jgi:hypothetical protein